MVVQVAGGRGSLPMPLLVVVLVALLGIGSIRVAASFHAGPLLSASFADYVVPGIGIVVDRDGRVVTVDGGSAAEGAGIQVGDTLEAIGDTPVRSGEEAGQVFGRLRAEQTVPASGLILAVRRDGQLRLGPVFKVRARGGWWRG